VNGAVWMGARVGCRPAGRGCVAPSMEQWVGLCGGSDGGSAAHMHEYSDARRACVRAWCVCEWSFAAVDRGLELVWGGWRLASLGIGP
jgi:hypothetical protein